MLKELGYLECFNSSEISGWALILDSESKYVFVKIEESILRVDVEDKLRADLPNNCRAFKTSIPGKYLKRDFLTVSVYNSEGKEFYNSPVNVVLDAKEKSKVAYGEAGWLFLTNDSNNFEKYLDGSMDLLKSTINFWISKNIERNEICKKLNIDFRSVIVPEKESLYYSYRKNFALSSSRPMLKINEACIDSGFVECFKNTQISNSQELYYKGDTHWNYKGAYYSFLNILESFGLEGKLGSLESFAFRKEYMSGDLRSKLEEVNIELVDYYYNPDKEISVVYDNKKTTTGRCMELISPNAKIQAKIMLWHTSSADWWLPFLTRTFSHIKMFWNKSIDWEEVKSFEPDYMIFQTNERFLNTAPADKFNSQYKLENQ